MSHRVCSVIVSRTIKVKSSSSSRFPFHWRCILFCLLCCSSGVWWRRGRQVTKEAWGEIWGPLCEDCFLLKASVQSSWTAFGLKEGCGHVPAYRNRTQSLVSPSCPAAAATLSLRESWELRAPPWHMQVFANLSVAFCNSLLCRALLQVTTTNGKSN